MYQQIFKKLQFCPDIRTCLQQTLDQNFAVITYEASVGYVIAKEFTDRNGEAMLHVARDGFYPGTAGFGLQKNSPLKVSFKNPLCMFYVGLTTLRLDF